MGYSLKVFFALLARYFLLNKQKETLERSCFCFLTLYAVFKVLSAKIFLVVLDDYFDPG